MKISQNIKIQHGEKVGEVNCKINMFDFNDDQAWHRNDVAVIWFYIC